ncbi:MAG: c-type cytochrome [Deltaproteobacteria bacterium]|nr:c-type cytochrome [Deltaproteobacteria bacterium]
MSTRLSFGTALFVCALTLRVSAEAAPPVAAAEGPGSATHTDDTSRPLPARWTPTEAVPSSPELIKLGEQVYTKQCVACHGAKGDGEGEAAYLLYPKPRNFRTGRFRLVSTWEGMPTDEDLYLTISRGMPGSAMPSWGHLSEKERWGLVHYVKSLMEAPITIKPSAAPAAEGQQGTGIVIVPPEPPYDAAAQARAQELFKDACASCHGVTGKGDGVDVQRDEAGYPTRPRDLTLGVFKGSPEPEVIYRRIIAGLPGSPMPMSDWAYGNDAWHLVHFVRSLSSDAQRARAEMRRFAIPVTRVAKLPDHPDAGTWASTRAINLHLMPLWWRTDRPEEVTVRALHDGKDIAFQLVWQDITHDATAMRTQDFRDAAAVELSATADPPFFAMGAKGQFVNIWMWKSERQADLEPAFQDLEKVYPNLGIDSYPNLLKSAVEQPLRHALTLESDPTFVTAWGAGNIVADPTRASAAEDLTAQGFGTLRARPPVDHTVAAKGVYGTDSYRVVFRRALKGKGEGAVTLEPGTTVPVAFAIWNGTAGDRDGKKSVTIWQELNLEK